MVERFTLLKDLPWQDAGATLLVKGGRVSRDNGETWEKPCSRAQELLELRNRTGWVRVEPTDVVDDRPHLETLVGKPLLKLRDALVALGWSFEDTPDSAINIRCCGQPVKLEGIIGVDRGYCVSCEKAIFDASGFQWAGRSSMGLIDPDNYQANDGRTWLIKTGASETVVPA